MHKKAFPDSAKSPEFGYPDSGNGFYGKKLAYPDWFRFQNAQRTQINFLEHMCFAILSPFLIYPSYPTASLVLATMVFCGRLIFTVSYAIGGPSARLPGALIMDAGIFIGFGYVCASCYALIQ